MGFTELGRYRNLSPIMNRWMQTERDPLSDDQIRLRHHSITASLSCRQKKHLGAPEIAIGYLLRSVVSVTGSPWFLVHYEWLSFYEMALRGKCSSRSGIQAPVFTNVYNVPHGLNV